MGLAEALLQHRLADLTPDPGWKDAAARPHQRLRLRSRDGQLLSFRASIGCEPDGARFHIFLQPAADPLEAERLAHLRHELRTPLHAIIGFAQLLEAELSEPAQQLRLQELLVNARALLGRMNELLRVAAEPPAEALADPGHPLAEPLSEIVESLAEPIAALSAELREHLRNLLLPDWETIAESRSFARIREFALQVDGLARELGADSLVQYARELEQSCRIFDPQSLRRLVGQFPSLLEEAQPSLHES